MPLTRSGQREFLILDAFNKALSVLACYNGDATRQTKVLTKKYFSVEIIKVNSH